MLLQSHEGYISPLAALPKAWADGSYTGLVARGNFEVSAFWENGLAKIFNITSKSGGTATVYYPSITNAYIVDSDGNTVNYTVAGTDLISFETEAGKTYIIYGFTAVDVPNAPTDLVCTENASGDLNFNWSAVSGASSYNVYVALENAADYTLIGTTSTNSFTYTPSADVKELRTTYAVTAVGDRESKRSLVYTSETIVTEYGEIPSSSVNADATFAIFAKKSGATTYKFIETGTDFVAGGIDKARQYLKTGSGTYQGGTIVIYMLTDHTFKGTSSGAGWNSAFQMNGTLVIDLGGNKLTSTAPRLIGAEIKSDALGYDKTTGIEFKNGTLCTSKPIVELFGGSGLYTGTKNCNITFRNITFTPNGTPSEFTMLNARGSFSTTQKANFNVTFDTCDLSYASLSKLTVINDSCVSGAVTTSLDFKGGNIYAASFDALKLISGASDKDSTLFSKNSKGARTEFTVKYTSTAPTVTFNTDDGIKHLASAKVDNTVSEDKRVTTYRLSSFKTPYGYIPENLKDSTTFSLFYNDLHIASYGVYLNAEKKIQELTYPNAKGIYIGQTLTLYMRKDYEHSDTPYNNFAQIDGTYVLDLGGNVLTMKSNHLFDIVGKAVNSTILKTTYVTVKNGTILTNNEPIMKIVSKGTSGNFGYNGIKPYSFTYENVTFDKGPHATKYAPLIAVGQFDETTTKNLFISAVFNNCSFRSSDSLLFDLSVSNYIDADVKINGGNLTANKFASILKSSDSDDKLSFSKSEDGHYMSLTLPATQNAPSVTFGNGQLHFVKVYENDKTVTYRLRDKAFDGFTYTPKTSLTLDENIVINVYVPAEMLVKFTLGGAAYENLAELEDNKREIDGKIYYLISTPIDAASGVDALTLVATVEKDGIRANAKFTFSVPKYAKKVFDAGTLVEKQLMRDMLSYIRAAYVYFKPTTLNAISTVDALIGKNYDVTSQLTPEGSTDSSTEGLIGASLNLSESPGIRFYIASDANPEGYSFYRIENGKEIALVTESGTDKNGRYLEVDIYAYAMCDTIYYRTVGGASGNYHIASYHAWAKTQNNDALVSLVERLWKYTQSARDYRNAVRITVNYVDESGNELAAAKTVTKAPGEEISLASPAVDGYYTRQLYVYSSASESETVNVVYKPIPANIDHAKAKELLANISAWGDSITEGSNAGNLTAANDHGIDLEALGSTAAGGNYGKILKNLIATKVYSGITVYNLGVGSETTATIAARANTENYYFYINEAVTLTDSPVVIDLQQNKGLNLDGRLGVLRRVDNGGLIKNVTMMGKDENGNEVSVKGLLTCVADSGQNIINCDYQYLTYTFTRTDGKTDKVIFDRYTRVVTDGAVLLDGNTCIIFMGENGGYNKDNATIIAQQEEILEACGSPEFFLIVSSTSKTTAARKSLNDALTARWGKNYINAGDLLNSSRASYEFAGYSEEAIVAVLDNIIEGSVTDLLLADGCHPNAVGYAVIANAMFERFFELGAFDAIFDYYDSLNSAN